MHAFVTTPASYAWQTSSGGSSCPFTRMPLFQYPQRKRSTTRASELTPSDRDHNPFPVLPGIPLSHCLLPHDRTLLPSPTGYSRSGRSGLKNLHPQNLSRSRWSLLPDSPDIGSANPHGALTPSGLPHTRVTMPLHPGETKNYLTLLKHSRIEHSSLRLTNQVSPIRGRMPFNLLGR
jgi:hypothetical protein